MDRYRSLEAFVEVADAMSITKAATHLGVSKSVVSNRIAQLEDHIGEKLFERVSRRMELSHAGSGVYQGFAELVARLNDIENAVVTGDGDVRGTLRVAAMIDTGSEELAAACAAFMLRNPESSVDLVLNDGYIDPSDHGCDVAFHYRPLSSDNLAQQKVVEVRCDLYASPSYIARYGVPKVPQDILNHDCLGYMPQGGVFDWNTATWGFARNDERLRINVDLKARFNSSAALRTVIAQGLGIGILPRTRSANLVSEGKLVRLMTDYRNDSLWLYSVCSKAQAASFKTRRFIDFVCEYLIATVNDADKAALKTEVSDQTEIEL